MNSDSERLMTVPLRCMGALGLRMRSGILEGRGISSLVNGWGMFE